MADIDGGSIHFEATLNDNASEKLETLKRSIASLSETIASQTDDIDKLEQKLQEVTKAGADAFMAGNDEIYRASQEQAASINAEIRAIKEERDEASNLLESYRERAKEVQRLAEATQQSAEKQQTMQAHLRGVREEMAQLTAAGEKGSERYFELAEDAAETNKALVDTKRTMADLIKQTTAIDAAMGSLTLTSGIIQTVTGVMGEFSGSTEEAAKMQTKLQSVMAIGQGIQQVAAALEKKSNLMRSISVLQIKAQEKATKMKTAADGKATIAQKLLNKVAAANPYVLLAIAITTVVGALVAMAAGAESAAEKMKRLNEQEEAHQRYLNEVRTDKNRDFDQEISEAQRAVDIAKSRNASLAEQKRLEDELYDAKLKKAQSNAGDLKQTKEEIEAERERARRINETIEKLDSWKRYGWDKLSKKMGIDVDFDGVADKGNIDELKEQLQKQLNLANASIDMKIGFVADEEDLEAEREQQLNERKQASKDAARTEREILKAEKDNEISLMKDGYAKQDAVRNAAYDRAISDLKYRISTEQNLTAKAANSLRKQIEQQEKLKTLAQEESEKERAKRLQQLRKELYDEQASIRDDSAANQRLNLKGKQQEEAFDMDEQLRPYVELAEKRTEAENAEYQILLDKQKAMKERHLKEQEDLEKNLVIRELDMQNERLQAEKDIMEQRGVVTKEGLDSMLQMELDMIENRRQAELAADGLKDSDQRMGEEMINKKYGALVDSTLIDYSRQFGEYAAVFDDIGNKSKQQLNEALKKIKQILAVIKGEAEYSEDLGISKDAIEAIKRSPAEIEAIYSQLTETQEKFNEQSGYPFAALVQGLKDLATAASMAAEAENETDEATKKIRQEEARSFKARALKAVADTASDAADMVNEVASSMREFAEVAGNEEMMRAAETLEKVGSVMSGISSGAAAGSAFGPWGTIIGAILGAVKELAGIFMNMKAEEVAATKAMKDAMVDYANSIALVNLQLKDIYNNGYGERSFSRISQAAKNANEALQRYQQSQLGAAEKIYEKWNLVEKKMPNGKVYETNRNSAEYLAGLQALMDGGYKASAEYLMGQAIKKGSNVAVRDLAPDLFDKDGLIDVEKAEQFLKVYDVILDDSIKKQIQSLIDLKKAYEENTEAIKEELISNFGYLGDDAMSAIVGGIADGTRAWLDFKDAGVKAFESIGEKIIYDKILASQFDALTERLNAVDAGMSPEQIAEEYARITSDWMGGMEQTLDVAQAFGEDFQRMMKDRYGMELWQDSNGVNSMSGAIKNITEETASIIAGQMNAIRVNQVVMSQTQEAIRSTLQGIKGDTTFLRQIDSKLSQLTNSQTYSERLNS